MRRGAGVPGKPGGGRGGSDSSEPLVSLGIALNSAGWIAAWYRGASRRTEQRPGVWGRHGRGVALAGALIQLGAGSLWLGWVVGLTLVLGAWMVLGSVFVPCVNTSPGRTLAGAGWLGALGGLLLAAGLLFPWLGCAELPMEGSGPARGALARASAR